MKNLVVLQSGGPTSVINSSLYGVIKEAKKHKEINKVYGSLYGITGLINNNLTDLSIDFDNLELLKQTPGAALGSARVCLSDDLKDESYNKILNTLNEKEIKYVLLIGGNDSMDTTYKLSHYFKVNNIDINVIGVPKTIDNDLVLTDHTPGFSSAAKYVMNTVSLIASDTNSYSKGRVTIIEVMGRGAGWLTASAKLSSLNGYGPDLIYLPETSFNVDKFLKDVKEIYDKNKKVLVVISEGLKDENREYLLSKYQKSETNDGFGHTNLEGTALLLTNIVKSKLNLPVRDIELNLAQRTASYIASLTDINEAIKCGECGVKNVLKHTGKMVSMERVSDYKIKYKLKDVSKIRNEVKEFPLEWIIDDNDISTDFIKYITPLIIGEPKIKYNNGLIELFKIEK